MGKEKKVQFPWQMISVDLIGPLPTSTKGYSYLLVIVDWFTKYVVLFPLRKATSSKVTECIENGIFLVYGVPQFIFGRQRQAVCRKRICKDLRELQSSKDLVHSQVSPSEQPWWSDTTAQLALPYEVTSKALTKSGMPRWQRSGTRFAQRSTK
jgi:hypothetical protein